MSNWKESKLTEMGSLQRGRSRHRPRYAFHLYGGQYPFIQTGEIKAASKYITHFEQTYSEAGLVQSKLWEAGTLCITIAANIAEIAILTFDACFPDSVLGFVPNPDKCDLDFVFYLLKHFQREIQAHGDGSVQDNINLGTFDQIEFPFPPLPTQRAIAEVLSSLDDKIDLLTRQNVTLEVLAQTYFRQWFVEGGAPTGRLDSIAKVTMGQSPQGESYNESGMGTIFFQGRGEFGWRYPTVRLYTTKPQRMAQKGDILMSVRAPVGDINIANKDCCVGRGLAAIHSEYPTFTFYAIKEQSEQLEIFNGEGTVFGSISKDGLNGLEIHLPSKQKIMQFEERYSMLDEKIAANSTQIRILQTLRDTLLPKLISGEVRIKQDGGD